MANYCTAQEAADHAVLELTDIQGWWLDSVDTLMENYIGYGYKGRTITLQVNGQGGRLMKLPRLAATVVSLIDEDGIVPDTDSWVLEPRGRILRRKVGTWRDNAVYTVVLVEPALTLLPDDWHLCAVAMVAEVAMFIKKYQSYGVALTASDAGQAGKVSTAASTSFPASLEEELKRKMRNLLRRPLV